MNQRSILDRNEFTNGTWTFWKIGFPRGSLPFFQRETAPVWPNPSYSVTSWTKYIDFPSSVKGNNIFYQSFLKLRVLKLKQETKLIIVLPSRFYLVHRILQPIPKLRIWICRTFLKFIYSEKATNFCEIYILDLSYVVRVKSTVEILQNFVAFSE